MSYAGQVVNGVVVLPADVRLPEGAEVRVEIVTTDASSVSPLTQELLQWAGKGQDLPVDLAKNHDHYLHGSPKQ